MMSASDDAETPKCQRIARIILVDGSRIKTLKVQTVGELKVDSDITAEGRRLAEFLYWSAPWRYYNALRDRLNELQPPAKERDDAKAEPD